MSDPKLAPGTNHCRCMACGQYFTTPNNFDKHQRSGDDGRPVCKDPATVGLVLGDAGLWHGPPAETGRFAVAQIRQRTQGAEVVAGDLATTQMTLSPVREGDAA